MSFPEKISQKANELNLDFSLFEVRHSINKGWFVNLLTVKKEYLPLLKIFDKAVNVSN